MGAVDDDIKAKIIDQLHHNSRIDSSRINVSVEGGAVTLGGTVPTFMVLQAASNAAWTVPGVASVDNQIRVEYPRVGILPQDKDIESSIERTIDWNPELDDSDIAVSVKEGCVMLEGSVNAYWKKVQAEKLASNIRGVVEITNKLSVVPTNSIVDENIAQEIIEALDRNVVVESGTVGVKVENGVVTLSGTVPNWATKNAVFFTAVYTDGVSDVDDRVNLKQP